MYHIVNDARAKKSANLLVHATITLANQKNFNEISISELQRVSSVSRSTFYRLFDTPVDVLAYACEQMMADAEEEINRVTDADAQHVQLLFIEACMKRVDLLRALVASDKTGLLRAAHHQHMSTMMESMHLQQTIQADTTDYINNIMADILPSAMFVWLAHGRREDAATVSQQIRASIQVLSYLYGV